MSNTVVTSFSDGDVLTHRHAYVNLFHDMNGHFSLVLSVSSVKLPHNMDCVDPSNMNQMQPSYHLLYDT